MVILLETSLTMDGRSQRQKKRALHMYARTHSTVLYSLSTQTQSKETNSSIIAHKKFVRTYAPVIFEDPDETWQNKVLTHSIRIFLRDTSPTLPCPLPQHLILLRPPTRYRNPGRWIIQLAPQRTKNSFQGSLLRKRKLRHPSSVGPLSPHPESSLTRTDRAESKEQGTRIRPPHSPTILPVVQQKSNKNLCFT
ncbi:hypothetical protein BCR34DRAFT_272486 [Clohesyomyces aquaticus]|uniref:Uncharacterized protein n=1 Tax=Clohesyomyces aquaticus TaxID=1231657 RepID=A0A1Y1ZSM3_9PLEO|nr:hypothetical protein BCR34DRAFT_272486 [Clohesyomyces aquaticus]